MADNAACDGPEWEAFRCRIPNSRGRSSRDGARLKSVYHVAHVPDACQILSDRRIRAARIADESVLSPTATSVAWLSANRWVNGSIYGHVRFEFDWSELVEHRQVYWVERADYHRSRAFRFLVTDRSHDRSSPVQRYDPASDRGPLRRRDGEWFCNAADVSEFMFEGGLPLSRCKAISFVDHHPQNCRLGACGGKGLKSWEAGAQVVAFVLSHRLTRSRSCFCEQEEPRLRYEVRNALQYLLDDLDRDRWQATVVEAGKAKSVLRGALALYGDGLEEDAKDLVAQLKNRKSTRKALESLTAEHFRLRSVSLE